MSMLIILMLSKTYSTGAKVNLIINILLYDVLILCLLMSFVQPEKKYEFVFEYCNIVASTL